MKASLNCGHGSTKHNDRSFDHDRERPEIYVGKSDKLLDEKFTLEQFELAVYSKLYGEYIERHNELEKKRGHKDRIKTVSDYLHSPKTRPTEAILQIGSIEESITADKLKEIYSKTVSQMIDKYPCLHVLDAAVHTDESTPHIHMRYTMRDSSGRSNKTHALIECGCMPPEPDKPISRYNNPQMRFTAELREIFELNAEKVLNRNLERSERISRAHLPVAEYKVTKMREQLANMHNELDELKNEYNDKKLKAAKLDETIKHVTGKNIDELDEYTKVRSVRKDFEKETALVKARRYDFSR